MRLAMRPLRTVALLAALAALVGCGKKPEPVAPSPPPGDREKLQGLWAIESLDEARPLTERMREEIKNDRIKVEGDKFTIISRGEEIKFTFTLDENQNPKVLRLTEVIDGESKLGGRGATSRGTKRADPPPAREPEKWDWIYKFEGDALVFAFIKGEKGEKPAEFKARTPKFEPDKPFEPGVTVLTVKKTDVPAPPAPPRPTAPFGTRK